MNVEEKAEVFRLLEGFINGHLSEKEIILIKGKLEVDGQARDLYEMLRVMPAVARKSHLTQIKGLIATFENLLEEE